MNPCPVTQKSNAFAIYAILFFVLSHKYNLSSVHKKTKQCPLLFPGGLEETKAIQTNLISQLNEHS